MDTTTNPRALGRPPRIKNEDRSRIKFDLVLPDAIIDALDEHASATGSTRSGVLRRLLTAKFAPRKPRTEAPS